LEDNIFGQPADFGSEADWRFK